MSRPQLNLIAHEDAQKLRRDIFFLVASRLLLGFFVLGAIIAVEIFAAWQNLSIFASTQQEQQQLFERRPEVIAAKELEQNLNETRVLINRGDAFFANALVWHQAVEAVLDAIPPEIRLESFVFSQKVGPAKKESAIHIALAGIAAERGDIRNLEDALKELPGFIALDSPIQNIIPRADISFRMNVSLSLP